jgi:hypothetical protein
LSPSCQDNQSVNAAQSSGATNATGSRSPADALHAAILLTRQATGGRRTYHRVAEQWTTMLTRSERQEGQGEATFFDQNARSDWNAWRVFERFPIINLDPRAFHSELVGPEAPGLSIGYLFAWV